MNILDKLSDDEIMELANTDFGDALTESMRARGFEYGWHKPTVYVGVIYIMVNPAFPTLIKIGYADDVKKRLKSLSGNSGVPDPYHCYATFAVKTRLKDTQVHALIDELNPELRHMRRKEFYEMPPETAYNILSAIAHISSEEAMLVKNPLKDSYFATDEEDHTASRAANAQETLPAPVPVHAATPGAAEEPVKRRKPRSNIQLPRGIYTAQTTIRREDNRSITATYVVTENSCYLQAGSEIAVTDGGCTQRQTRALRAEAKFSDGILQEDLPCTFSEAAALVTASTQNAWDFWKIASGTNAGEKINILRQNTTKKAKRQAREANKQIIISAWLPQAL